MVSFIHHVRIRQCANAFTNNQTLAMYQCHLVVAGDGVGTGVDGG